MYFERFGAENQRNDEFSFIFKELSINGTLVVSSSNYGAVGARLSEVNTKDTKLCSPQNPGVNDPGTSNSPILSYDPLPKAFAYQVSSNNYNTPVLNWSVWGRRLLFVLAVDVFPGETVSLSGLSASYTVTDPSGMNSVTCPSVNIVQCDNVTLYARHATGASNNVCGQPLSLDIWIGADNNTNVTDLRFVLDVKKHGTFQLSSSTTSPYCLAQNCITVTDISADYMRIAYTATNISGLSVGPNHVNPGLVVSIALEAINGGGCIEGITFRDAVLYKEGAATECLTKWASEFDLNAAGDDICTGNLRLVASNVNNNAITGWTYYINRFTHFNHDYPIDCYQSGGDSQNNQFCVCFIHGKEQNVTLLKNDNPLNGVSTFDLVLITKHILYSTQDSSYKLKGFDLLAADADLSGHVTVSDVVEIRKLILGLLSEFGSNRSWRFIDQDLKSAIIGNPSPFGLIHPPPQPPATFSAGAGGSSYYDPADPNSIPINIHFANEEFDEFSLPETPTLDARVEFVGFKVGDVNNTALPSFQTVDDRNLAQWPLGVQAVKGTVQETVEISVFALEQQSVQSWQMGIGYDTAALEVTGIRWPNAIPAGKPEDQAWSLTHPGELRVLWFDADAAHPFASQTALFYVQAKLKKTVDIPSPNLVYPLQNSIAQEAYFANGAPAKIMLRPTDLKALPVLITEKRPESSFLLSVYPNPAGDNFRLDIQSDYATPGQLIVRNIMGGIVWQQSVDLGIGQNSFASRTLPALSAGQYLVSLYPAEGKATTIRLVKQ